MINSRSAFDEVGKDFRRYTSTIVRMSTAFGDIDEQLPGSWMINYQGDIDGTVTVDNRDEIVEVVRKFARFIHSRRKKHQDENFEYNRRDQGIASWTGTAYYLYKFWYKCGADGWSHTYVKMNISLGEEATCRIEEVEEVVPATESYTRKVKKMVCD